MASKKSKSKKHSKSTKKTDHTTAYVAAGVGAVVLTGLTWLWYSSREDSSAALPEPAAPPGLQSQGAPDHSAATVSTLMRANSALPPAQGAAASLKTYYISGGRDAATIRRLQTLMGGIDVDGTVGPQTVARAQALGISMELTAGDKARFHVA